MKLYYFHTPGRAECARIMLKLSGAEYEDIRFDKDAWVSTYKSKSPTGQAPMLELDDGHMIAQSTAIDRYIGKAGGFYPDDALDAAKVDMFTACLEEVFQTVLPTMSLPDDEKTPKRQALFAEGGAAYVKAMVLEKLVANKMSEFFVSDKLSLADLSLYVVISMISSGFLDGLSRETWSCFPELLALRDKVASHPDIVPIYAEVSSDDPMRAGFKPPA